MRSRTDSVWCAENMSVENVAMAASHNRVGSQASTRTRSEGGTGLTMTDVANATAYSTL